MALLGLPPVDLHGPLHHLGIMDPLCGGTRAARYTVLGDWSQAWRFNPLDPVAVLLTALITARGAVGLVSGRWLTLQVHWSSRRRRAAWALGAVALILLEIRQQSIVTLLTAPA